MSSDAQSKREPTPPQSKSHHPASAGLFSLEMPVAFQDYSTTPANNTTIGTDTFIGPNMLRNKVRPALQQLAADGRALYEYANSLVINSVGTARVSITDFGAVGNNATNNDAAFAEAISAVQNAGGGDLFIPQGEFLATSITVPDGPVVNFIGEGEQSIIKTTSATADLLVVNAWYSQVRGIKFMSSVTRTAGIFVHAFGAFVKVEHNHLVGDFVGIKLTGVGAKAISNVFDSGATGARRIWVTGGDTSQEIASNVMNAQGPGVEAGIFVDHSAAAKIHSNDVIGQGRCLHIAPSTGQSVFSLKSHDNFYDTAAYGIAVEPSGTGTVHRCRSSRDWGSSHTVRGAQFTTTGSAIIDGFDLDFFEGHMNIHGIALSGAATSNVRIYKPLTRQNSDSGISIGNDVQNFEIDGQRANLGDGLTSNQYAVFLGTGVDNYIIKNGDYRGQTTAAIAGHTETATRVTSNNRT